MHVYLTKVHGGRYLMTRLPPVIRTIRGTDTLDAFSQPGEPLDVRHLCEEGVKALLGRTLEPLVPEKIEIRAMSEFACKEPDCRCKSELKAEAK